jgi:hypothetical protein
MEVLAIEPKLRRSELPCRAGASRAFGGTEPERSRHEQEPSAEDASA